MVTWMLVVPLAASTAGTAAPGAPVRAELSVLTDTSRFGWIAAPEGAAPRLLAKSPATSRSAAVAAARTRPRPAVCANCLDMLVVSPLVGWRRPSRVRREYRLLGQPRSAVDEPIAARYRVTSPPHGSDWIEACQLTTGTWGRADLERETSFRGVQRPPDWPGG